MHYQRWYHHGDPLHEPARRIPKPKPPPKPKVPKLTPEEDRQRRREYSQRPDVRERKNQYRREYIQRSEVRAHRREYQREYTQRPEVRQRLRKYKRQWHQRPEVRAREYRYKSGPKSYETSRAWYERNRDYIARRGKVDRERRRQIPAPRAGEQWSAAEYAIIAREDITLTEMCYMLGRSYAAVAIQRAKLGAGTRCDRYRNGDSSQWLDH